MERQGKPSDSYMDPPPRTAPRSAQLSQPTLPSCYDFSAGTFRIVCNHCGKSIPNEHFHCSICEKGDFDLCRACHDSGVTCDGDDHLLIKRHIRNGSVVAHVTDECQPRKHQKVEVVALTSISLPCIPEACHCSRCIPGTCNCSRRNTRYERICLLCILRMGPELIDEKPLLDHCCKRYAKILS